MVVIIVKVKLQTNLCFLGSVDGPSVLMEGVSSIEDNTNITTNREIIRKKTMVGLQFYFYSYYNNTLLPVTQQNNFKFWSKELEY